MEMLPDGTIAAVTPLSRNGCKEIIMRKFPWTKDGMRQILDSPHKGFNKRCVALCEGNVWDLAYHSTYIRPYSMTDDRGFTRPEWKPGYLRNYDFNLIDAPCYVRNFLDNYAEDTGLVVMRVYGQGWLAYLRQGNTNKVLRYWLEYGMPKALPLLAWIKDALETPTS